MNLELPAKDRQILEELLARHVPQAEVWAYGSRVTGASHESSDLDLVLRAMNPLPCKSLLQLRSALRESSLPIQVEVRDWSALPKGFQAEIEREHVVVQKPR